MSTNKLFLATAGEIYDNHADERGQELVAMLVNRVRQHDPRRNAYITHGSNYMQWENAQKCADIPLDTTLSYAPGKLTAIAYGESGVEKARDSVKSFGGTAQIRLTAENSVFRANGTDLMFIDIDAYDKDGVFVANANNRGYRELQGRRRILSPRCARTERTNITLSLQ